MWTVFDASTGRPADMGSRIMIGMTMDDADEIVIFLNRHRTTPAGGRQLIDSRS